MSDAERYLKLFGAPPAPAEAPERFPIWEVRPEAGDDTRRVLWECASGRVLWRGAVCDIAGLTKAVQAIKLEGTQNADS
jgi:hypothetical protein